MIPTLALYLAGLLLPAAPSSDGLLPARHVFSALTVDNGLPHNFVDDIYKDSLGFIWISTRGGLARHDGHDFLLFDVNTTPVALKSNSTRGAREDAFHRLWVISAGGVDVIDLLTMLPASVQADDPAFARVAGLAPTVITRDGEGSIWLLSNDNVHRVAFTPTGRIARVDTAGAPAGPLYTALRVIDDTVYAATAGKLFSLAPGTPGTLRVRRAFPALDAGDNAHVTSFTRRGHVLWAGTDNGLFRVDTRDGSSRAFTHDPDDPASLSQNMVTDIATRDDGPLLVATLRGLNILVDTAAGRFLHVDSHDKHPNGALDNDFINCLAIDDNILWIGTEAGGVNKMIAPHLPLHHAIHDPADPASLSAGPVNAIVEDARGNLWVGTVEGGLNRAQPGENAFTRYSVATGHLPHNSVSALEETPGHRLWVGTWGGGIAILRVGSERVSLDRTLSLETDYIGVIKHDSLNRGTWIGTNRDVFFHDDATGEVSRPLSPALTRDVRGTLGCIIDRHQQLWIGTSAGIILVDLSRFDRREGHCPATRFSTGDARLDRLFLPRVTCFHEARDGAIWIGSDGHGVYRVAGDESTHLTTAGGLANNTVFGILEDERGRPWIATARGITVLDPATGHVTAYSRDDGLLDNQFYWNAAYKSPRDKSLYFGGVTGLTRLDGARDITPAPCHPLVFTRLSLPGKTIAGGNNEHLDRDISRASVVRLHERDKSFSIEFSALDHDNSATIAYAYRFDGFDDNWIALPPGQRAAGHTNLPPGRYTLQARATSREHGDDAACIQVVVRPYFYKTAWFVTSVVVATLLLAWLAYRQRVATLNKQKKILQVKVRHRTRRLQQQAIELKRQNDALEAQQKQLVDVSAKLRQNMTERVAFFTNITHELRAPVTLLAAPLDRAIDDATDPALLDRLQLARREATHLLSLVDQLMDFRKMESGNISVHLREEDFPAFLAGIARPFRTLLEPRGVTLRELYRFPSPRLPFDAELTRKLFTNLLANAAKFTPDGGTITLLAALSRDPGGGERLHARVSDTGPGIKEEDLLRVFNPFFQSKGNAERPVPPRGIPGTGIGLYLCKNIVELLGGTIVARNNPRHGASFRVTLPVTRGEGEKTGEDDGTTATSRRRLTILVVEDDDDTRSYILSILHPRYRVEEAPDGERALELLKTQRVDFIISDLVMPGIDGLELARRVKDDPATARLPFLVLTARNDTATRVDSYKSGVDDFLVKPFDAGVLLARVENILERREADRRRFATTVDATDLNLPEGSPDERFLHRAVEVVRSCYADPAFDVTAFIAAMKTSKSLLNKKMQALVGLPAGHFIRDYRLNAAREILRENNGNLTVAEIAYAVGFNDPKYFTRCFTRRFGVAPSAARQVNEKHDNHVTRDTREAEPRGYS